MPDSTELPEHLRALEAGYGTSSYALGGLTWRVLDTGDSTVDRCPRPLQAPDMPFEQRIWEEYAHDELDFDGGFAMTTSCEFRKIGNTFVAEATGFDLTRKLTPAQVGQIESSIAEYGVLVFHDQPMDHVQQDAFIRQFGPERQPLFKEVAGGSKTLIDVGTVDDEGKPLGKDTLQGAYNLANRLWHTDGTFLKLPIRLTGLLARELPPIPPPTEYADMRAAWNALTPERQAELEGLQVIHNVVRSREQVGFTADKFTAETLKILPPVSHPLVRVHPFNRRKSLYLASHASHIEGWPVEKGRALIAELIAFATQPQFTYSLGWRKDDFVLWDDRWTMHRATPYDGPHPRKMRQCAVHETQPI